MIAGRSFSLTSLDPVGASESERDDRRGRRPSIARPGAWRAAPAMPMSPQERLQQEGKRMRVSATPKANTSLRASASATAGEAGEAEHREARARREAPATWAVPQHRARHEGKRTAPGDDAAREVPPVRPGIEEPGCPAAAPCRQDCR